MGWARDGIGTPTMVARILNVGVKQFVVTEFSIRSNLSVAA